MAAPVCAHDMAMMDCPQPESAPATSMDTACDTLTAANCTLPDPLPPSAQFSMDAFTPVAALLTVLPHEPAQAQLTGPPDRARYAARIPTPPRSLRNAVLLI